MSASESRFVAIWASHEARAKIWFRLFLVTSAGLALSLFTTIRVWRRPREVVRIGRGLLRPERFLFDPQRPCLVRQPNGARHA